MMMIIIIRLLRTNTVTTSAPTVQFKIFLYQVELLLFIYAILFTPIHVSISLFLDPTFEKTLSDKQWRF